MCGAKLSVTKDPHHADLKADVIFYRSKLILPLLEDGEDIVLVLHSYGVHRVVEL